MANGYRRIELDLCLVIEEVATLMMAASEGRMINFTPKEPKKAHGIVDAEGKHYSRRTWEVKMKKSCTASVF